MPTTSSGRYRNTETAVFDEKIPGVLSIEGGILKYTNGPVALEFTKNAPGDYRVKITTLGPDGTVKTELKFGNNRHAKSVRKDLLNKQTEGKS